MTGSSGEVEQAVSRTLRESLEKLQRTADELSRAVKDLASTCAGARPAESLPPMMRAQTAAASLSASLEALSRFVTAALQPELRSSAELEAVAEASQSATADFPEPAAQPPEPQPAEVTEIPPETAAEDASEIEPETVTVEASQASELGEEDASVAVVELQEPDSASYPVSPRLDEELPLAGGPFDVAALPAAVQELHRRASRVAKVSMQDIRMLRPKDVKLGRENKDLCERLRDDIEKAHKEYDRRFHTISAHPVDYFYDWMVEILGDGNPETLGQYPYPSPVLRS